MTENTPTKAQGRLGKALLRFLMERATIVSVEQLSERFRLITLESAAFRGATGTPGQKIQIAMGSAFLKRTYTPIEWDAVAGRTSILGYAHGDGPGAAWLRDVTPGDECDIFGPRRSLDASMIADPLVVFGDETSIALACALQRGDHARAVTCCLEVGNVNICHQISAYLELDRVELFDRSHDDAHIAEMEAKLPSYAATGATFLLTGKATTIQRLRQSLKRQAIPAKRILAKAYWAPDKTGLD